MKCVKRNILRCHAAAFATISRRVPPRDLIKKEIQIDIWDNMFLPIFGDIWDHEKRSKKNQRQAHRLKPAQYMQKR